VKLLAETIPAVFRLSAQFFQ